MTETEQARLKEARDRARSAAPGEHVDFTWRDDDDFEGCVRCGLVKPRTGWTKPCRGPARISLR